MTLDMTCISAYLPQRPLFSISPGICALQPTIFDQRRTIVSGANVRHRGHTKPRIMFSKSSDIICVVESSTNIGMRYATFFLAATIKLPPKVGKNLANILESIRLPLENLILM
jgi:hypothetical protein